MKKLDINTIPNTLANVLDEDELTDFIQESLIESGRIIDYDDAREVAEIAFDYAVYKLTEKETFND